MKKGMFQLSVLAAALAVAAMLTGCAGQQSLNEQTPHLTFEATLGAQHLVLKNPKDTIAKGLHLKVAPDGTGSLDVDEVSTVMKPENINATGDAESKILHEAAAMNHQTFQDVSGLVKDAAGAVGSVAGSAAKAAVVP
jgi:ABC-type uncharacterized transport system auxiliary subunit